MAFEGGDESRLNVSKKVSLVSEKPTLANMRLCANRRDFDYRR